MKMKKILLTAAMLTLATTVFAGPPPTTIKCAVETKNDVNIKTATDKKMYADYKGNRYFFCCTGCPEAFKKNPASFAKAPHIKTPKAPKAS
jgi:YHS domain-containing protein